MSRTQDQFYDLPFFYVFDADGLTDASSPTGLSVPLINTSEFFLRRIVGRPLVAATMRYRDEMSADRMSGLSAMLADYVVAPELHYGPVAQIGFDLGNVLRANIPYVAVPGSVPNYVSQLAFQGVRRFHGLKAPDSKYRYYDRPYTITQSFTITDAGRIAPAYQDLSPINTQSILVDNWDFEWLNLRVLVQKATDLVPVSAFANFKFTFYDCNGQALSTAPVLDAYYNMWNGAFNSTFPCPTMVYPANSQIKVDIQSLLINIDVPATLTLIFNGLWRFPC